MKQREEIRYYALKTTAATGPFIISVIFIIKNSSRWEAAEYSLDSSTWSLSEVKCVPIISVTLLLLTRQICDIHHVNIVSLTHAHARVHAEAVYRSSDIHEMNIYSCCDENQFVLKMSI